MHKLVHYHTGHNHNTAQALLSSDCMFCKHRKHNVLVCFGDVSLFVAGEVLQTGWTRFVAYCMTYGMALFAVGLRIWLTSHRFCMEGALVEEESAGGECSVVGGTCCRKAFLLEFRAEVPGLTRRKTSRDRCWEMWTRSSIRRESDGERDPCGESEREDRDVKRKRQVCIRSFPFTSASNTTLRTSHITLQYIASNATLHIDITSHQGTSSLRKIPKTEGHPKIGVRRNGRQKCEDAKMSRQGHDKNKKVNTKRCPNRNGLLGASWHTTNQFFHRRVSIGTCFLLPG